MFDKEYSPSGTDTSELLSHLDSGVVGSAIEKTYRFAKLMSYYRCAILAIETKFNILNEEFALRFDRQPISAVKTRLKNPLSIYDKMVKRGYPLTLESIETNLSDIAGVRVICSFVDDVYMLSAALKKQDDVRILEEKDYISTPKENGYRSLHLIVAVPIFLQQEKREMKAEIQLRTIAMDSWASLEHQLRYKKDTEFDDQMAADIRYCADLSAELDRRMDRLRGEVGVDQRTFPLPSSPGIAALTDGLS